MAYQKPEVVAKSAAKESFVAGCPVEEPIYDSCYWGNRKCMCGPLK